MLMKQRSRGRRTLSLLVAALMTLLLMVTPIIAGAEDAPAEPTQPPRQTVVISNTVRLSDLIAVDGDGEGEEGAPEEQEEPQGNTRVSIEWLEDSTYAPDTLIAIIGGSGQPTTVDLTRANGWAVSLDIDQATMTYYTLLGAQDYTVNTAEGEITFTVADAFENPDPEPEEEEIEEPPVEEIPEEEPVTEDINVDGVSLDITYSVTRDGLPINMYDGVQYGDVVVVKGHVDNPDGIPYTLQWQYRSGDQWVTINGATGDTYSYTLSEETIDMTLRLLFMVDASQVEQPAPEGGNDQPADDGGIEVEYVGE